MQEKIFSTKRPIFSKLIDFGFQQTEGGFVFKQDFMDGDFTAVISISSDGKVDSKAIDNMNDEEYTALHASGIVGGYVGDVRLAYEEILQRIAENCFEDVLFASDQANRITDKIAEIYGVSPDFPWDDETFKPYGVFRHKDSGKWFALIMNIKRKSLVPSADEKQIVDVVNLKKSKDLVEPYPDGVFPAYHMNHKLWISVLLDDTLSDEEIFILIQSSFNSTKKQK